METSIARTFAALSATNEAILYAKSPEELYSQVCEAAFSSGDFLATAVFLLEPGTSMLRFAAGFGGDVKRLCEIEISIAAETPEGLGVCGQAFRDGKTSVSNDYLNDARSLAWRDGATAARVGAAAALPLNCNGRSVGVLVVILREAGSLNASIVSLLERMSANISYALDNFDHEVARRNGERAMRRLNRMFGAISATNEAILHAKTEQELYRLVCDAAVHGGESTAAAVLLAEPDSIWLKSVAGTGEIAKHITRTRFSIDPDNVYGKGICGRAFRSQKACVNRDILNSVQAQPWHELGREVGVMAGVALPLIKAGTSVGVLLFFISKSWATDEEIVALMARIAENVSVSLDSFDRASEKAKSEVQKRASGADARVAERDQRSDHAGQVAHRDVRIGLRGGRARRQIQFYDHRACRARLRIPSHRCSQGAEGKRDEGSGNCSFRQAAAGTRAGRNCIPDPATVHQQRLSRR